MIGQTVGNYNVAAMLGRGGMGEVYLAEHPRIGRKVAIKLLHPELSADRRLVERLFDEALATNLVKHSGIVQVFDCGFQRDRAYLVMEYLEGENLGSLLKREKALSVPVACAFGGQLANALAAAHDHRIVHRDLKPDNIFVMPTGQDEVSLKIVDFGIAKLNFRPAGSDTDSMALLGTPAYMSPEQCAGAGLVDPRTDIYALGCILFEMVLGRRPFVYRGWGEYIAAHQSEPPPTPIELRPDLPRALNDLILQMLAKRPEDRPQAMGEIQKRLVAVREGLGMSDIKAPPLIIVKAAPRSTGGLTVSVPERTVLSRRQQIVIRQRRRWGWLAALTAAGALLVVGAALRSVSWRSPPAPAGRDNTNFAQAAVSDAGAPAVPDLVAAPVAVPSAPSSVPPGEPMPVQPTPRRPAPRAKPKPAAPVAPPKSPQSDRFRGFEDL